MRARSEVKRSAASSLESCKSCRVGLLSNEVEKCKVESSAYEWVGQFVTERRSLRNKRKRVVDGTEPCGTPLLIGVEKEQWPSTTAEIERSERKLEIKEQREGQKPKEGSLESKDLCQTLSKAFDMSSATEKVSPKRLREDDQESVRRERRSPVERPLRNPYCRSDRRSEVERCF